MKVHISIFLIVISLSISSIFISENYFNSKIELEKIKKLSNEQIYEEIKTKYEQEREKFKLKYEYEIDQLRIQHKRLQKEFELSHKKDMLFEERKFINNLIEKYDSTTDPDAVLVRKTLLRTYFETNGLYLAE